MGTLLSVVSGSYRESEFRDLSDGFLAANFEWAMSLVCPLETVEEMEADLGREPSK
jgi:hypothetical protein